MDYSTPNSYLRTMFVPDHIGADGSALPIVGNGTRRMDAGDRARLEKMNVPDRIVLTGGEGYRGTAEPRAVEYPPMKQVDALPTLPDRMTLANDRYHPDEPTNAVEDMRSQSSIAIDENPLDELKAMTKRFGRMTNRIALLEDEMQRMRDSQFTMGIVGMVGMAVLAVIMILKK